MQQTIKIAVLVTCHNRRELSLSCLRSLYSSLSSFNETSDVPLQAKVYLVDDGCSDGTARAVREQFADRDVEILEGDGNLYWAGGMRVAWKEALKRHFEWDYYLLLNDDTDMFEMCFCELFKAEKYSLEHYDTEGIVFGFCRDRNDCTKTTYFGVTGILGLFRIPKALEPSGEPALADSTGANILLVPAFVVDKIGILSERYVHGGADTDYTIRARRASIPVLVSAEYCGACDMDHGDERETILSMSREERKEYFGSPVHSNQDYLTICRTLFPSRYPIAMTGCFLRHNFPRVYFVLRELRDEIVKRWQASRK